jgi:HEAT repeat protein
MGLFDLFKKKGSGDGKKSSPAAKWAEAAGNKRAQTYDRQEALQELAAMGTADAAEALLKRFTFTIDPSITDQDEKDIAFQGVLKAGKDAIEPVRAFTAKAESLAWPMRVCKEILSEDEVIDELCTWLSRWDTEYSRFIDPKLQLLNELGDFKDERVVEAVTPFLEDVNEPARFHAVVALLNQDSDAVIGSLLTMLLEEESVRIKAKVADAFIQREWVVPEEQREPVRKVLPYEYGIDGNGNFTKR